MECFDTHIHSEGKGITELSKMANSGIKIAVSCAYYPIKPTHYYTLIDMFRKISSFEVNRGKKAGIELIPAVGIHPRCICDEWDKALNWIEENGRVIGEIGLETGSKEEVEVLTKQLSLAKKLDLPCIVHTPRKNKKAVTEKIIDVLKKSGICEDLVVVDHINRENLEIVLKSGYWMGLTVQPGKLSEGEAVSIIEEFGFERFLLNSDTGFNDLECLTVAKTVKILLEKFDKKDVKKVAIENGMKIFR